MKSLIKKIRKESLLNKIYIICEELQNIHISIFEPILSGKINMKERKCVKDIIIGDRFNNDTFCLKELKTMPDGGAKLTLSDKTGEITGEISPERFLSEYNEWTNNAVKITAIAVDTTGMKPHLLVRNIALAGTNEYSANELFMGLSKETIDEYLSMIKRTMEYVTHPGFRTLLDVAFTDIALQRLSSLPATINRFGTYAGGALAEAALVSEMCMRSCIAYVNHGNGLYSGGIDWSLLLTGALLCSYGNLRYLTDMPWKRTAAGMQRGYISTLQSSIEELIRNHNIPIDELDLAKLLNILGASVSFKTEVKSSCKEGIVLRHTMHIYQEMDILDNGVETYKEEHTEEERESYFYNKASRSYVSIQ